MILFMLFLHMIQTQSSNQWEQEHLTIWDNKGINRINLTVIGELSTENPTKIINDYCAFLVLEGHGFYEDINGFSQPLDPGTYVQHIPGLHHVIRRREDTPWMELSFRISPEPAHWLIREGLIDTSSPVRRPGDWQYRSELFLKFMAKVKTGLTRDSYRRVLAWILDWVDGIEADPLSLLDLIKKSLESDLSAPVSEKELLRNLNYSYGYLRGYFKDKTGETPRSYRERMRAGEAASLMKSSGLTVAAAAEMFGYSDPFVFSRAFKRVLGYPPSLSTAKKTPLAFSGARKVR